MALKPLLYLSLSLTGTLVLATSEACLDPKAIAANSKAACCAGSGTGQASVGGVLYEYTCNSYANNYGPSGESATNAYRCAELCLADEACHASSWQPNAGGSGGMCWKSSAGFELKPDPHSQWVILVNTGRAGHVIDPPITPIAPDPALQKCQADLEEALGSIDKCNSDLGTVKGDLTTCKGDLQTHSDQAIKCNEDLSLSNYQFTECSGELNACKGTVTKHDSDLEACNNKVTKCQGNLDECKNSQPPTPIATGPECVSGGYREGEIVTRNNRKFRIWCKASNHGSNDILPVEVVANVDECINLCSKTPRCVFAQFRGRDGQCRRRTQGNTEIQSENTGYDTGTLVQ